MENITAKKLNDFIFGETPEDIRKKGLPFFEWLLEDQTLNNLINSDELLSHIENVAIFISNEDMSLLQVSKHAIVDLNPLRLIFAVPFINLPSFKTLQIQTPLGKLSFFSCSIYKGRPTTKVESIFRL
jgi:hypothetical protein